MKHEEARKLIAQRGYRVSFERRENGMLCGDHFPERGEPPIKDIEIAWGLAEAFADVDPKKYVNVYVINADWTPVLDYDARKFNPHPPPD